MIEVLVGVDGEAGMFADHVGSQSLVRVGVFEVKGEVGDDLCRQFGFGCLTVRGQVVPLAVMTCCPQG